MALDQKLNFDTPPEETISADPDCSICYGRGTMNIANPASTGKYNTYGEKECTCITKARLKSGGLSNIFKGKDLVATNREDGTLKLTVKDKT